MEECMSSWPIATLLLFAGLSVTVFVAFSGFYSRINTLRRKTSKEVIYILGAFDVAMPFKIFLLFISIILAFMYIWTFGQMESFLGLDIQYFKIYSAVALTLAWTIVLISLLLRFIGLFEGKADEKASEHREKDDYEKAIR